ncbi:MAG: Na+/H+ antiporter subunit B [Fimbriimonadaceae bacterium]|nr:Na+/H+ antiporter subunit B [Fimbriimonadaceae bacterium]
MLPILLMFSLFLLWRGHNAPGGGFSGGLVAAAALTLHLLAFGIPATKKLLRVSPRTMIASGLLIAALSGVAPMFVGKPFMTGLWVDVNGTHLGTPMLFDLGVYVLVIGMALKIIVTISEEDR